MNIISIKEFYDGYKKKGRDLPIEMVFDEFCSELSGLKIINFCLVYEGDDKLDFIKHIAQTDTAVVSIYEGDDNQDFIKLTAQTDTAVVSIYDEDNKLNFIKHIARTDTAVVSIVTFDSRNLKIEGDEAVYSPMPEIKGRCIALVSDDELLRMLSKAV